MFVTSTVDIPEELIQAQRDGTLVVFVGAGVSVDPPSGLPLFQKLAAQIVSDAQRTIPPRQIRDQPDVVLGSLAEDDVPVHQRVRDLIGLPGSRPNRLHKAIAQLFRSREDVRVVTTNYDLHLETGLMERWGSAVDVFRAPALPLGHDFSGLVYLHGSISQDPARLVVTDGDFGRAYLNEGWAARFVHEMFRTYIVLFVGYSHGDRVMTYLARGLARDHQGRYAFTPEPSHGSPSWRSLRIQSVAYPIRSGRRSHRSLTEAVEAWADQARMGLLDHANRIKDMTSGDPPQDPVRMSYLSVIVGEPDRARLFVENASGRPWVDWLLQQDSVRSLFERVAILTPAQQTLAGWLAREVVLDRDRVAELSQLFDVDINPVMWHELARQVLQLQGDDSEAAHRWLPPLLRTARNADVFHFLDQLLIGCHWPEDRSAALLLFDWLTEPIVAPQTWPATSVRGEMYFLQQAWDSLLQPNLDECAGSLIGILTRHLETANRLLRVAGKAADPWDPLSFDRSAIEPHEQDQTLYDGIDVVIDACRDSLVTLINHEPDLGRGYLRSLEDSAAPVLRRIAVHAWTERSDVGSDDRLTWLLDRGWVWDFPAKHEVFRLVASALPGASAQTKERLLAAVLEGGPRE